MQNNQAMNEEDRQVEKQVNEQDEETVVKDCSIVVFGIPLVAGDRFLRLKKFLTKTFSAPSSDFVDLYPLDKEESTKGYCFIKYDSKEAADKAILLLHNQPFDKNHTFEAFPLAAFDNIEKPVEILKLPKFPPLVDVGDLWSWMQNPDCFDQFAVRFDNYYGKDGGNSSVDVYWNGRTKPTLTHEISTVYGDGIFKWSPEGSYLACLQQQQGVDIYAGPEFKKFRSLEHKHVGFMEFSSKESFLVTYSPSSRCSDDQRLRIFNVCTGELKKCFSWPSEQKLMVDILRSNGWPFIKWSADESYFAFARNSQNRLCVFGTNTFSLCDQEEIEMPGLVSFDWNPAKLLLAYYCEQKENSNVPAEIGILKIPSRQKLRSQRILVSVSAAHLFWQKSGDYLAALSERYLHVRKIKNKETNEVDEVRRRNVSYNLDIFDCRGSDISVISMQLEKPYCDFAWEPKGSRFCVLIGSDNRVTPLVYQLQQGKSEPLLISKISTGSLHSILWAPQNGWLTVYGYSSVFFIDASGSEAVMNRSIEHENLTKASWDPTGRYFVTCSTGVGIESGAFRIHSFQGRLLHRENKDMALVSFKWRPRPLSMLSEQETKEIRKNMKQLSIKFEEDDRKEQMSVFNKQNSHHRKAMEVFMVIREQNRVLYEQEHDERVELRKGIDSDITTEEDLVDEVINVPLATEEVKIDEKATE